MGIIKHWNCLELSVLPELELSVFHLDIDDEFVQHFGFFNKASSEKIMKKLTDSDQF